VGFRVAALRETIVASIVIAFLFSFEEQATSIGSACMVLIY